jgi:hypothetical protein
MAKSVKQWADARRSLVGRKRTASRGKKEAEAKITKADLDALRKPIEKRRPGWRRPKPRRWRLSRRHATWSPG